MGLEENDVSAVQESWKIAKSVAKLRDHGIAFFELLFTEHPSWRTEFFSHLGDAPMEDLKKTPKFRAHSTLVMSNLDSWVKNLDELDMVVASVQKLGQNHAARGIMSAQFATIGEVVLLYLKAGLKDQFTEEMEVGWTKLLDTVVAIIKENNEEGDE